MDLGFIDSPHLLAYVNYPPPSTRFKYSDELNQSYTLNCSYHTPVSKSIDPVKDGYNFLSSIFGVDQSQNKAKKAIHRDENSMNKLLWNTKTDSPSSHGDSMLCSSDDEFSPFMSSSLNSDTPKTVKALQDIRYSTRKLQHFVHDSHLERPHFNSSQNSTIFVNDSLHFLNQESDDRNSQNSENNSFEDSTSFGNDSLNFLKEESLQPLLEISPQLTVTENISQYPVSRILGELEKRIDVIRDKSVENSCTYEAASSNLDSCILHCIENNEVSSQYNADESNNQSVPAYSNLDVCIVHCIENNDVSPQYNADESNNQSDIPNVFQTTGNEIANEDFKIDLPFLSHKPYSKQILENNFTLLETPKSRCSVLNGNSEDTFEIPTQNLRAEDDHNSGFGFKYNKVKLENTTGILLDMADSFEFENKCGNTILEDDFTHFLNNELPQQPESIIKSKGVEDFHKDACDSTLGNMADSFESKNKCGNTILEENFPPFLNNELPQRPESIKSKDVGDFRNDVCGSTLGNKVIRFHPENTSNLMPENACGTKSQSGLRYYWESDCGVSAFDKKIMTAGNMRENLNFECDVGLCSNGRQFHSLNDTNMMSGNACGVRCRSELIDSLKTDGGISISDKLISATSNRENVSSRLCTADQQITICSYIEQQSEHMSPIQNMKIPESGIDSFMKVEPLLRNDFGSRAFTQSADHTLFIEDNFRIEQSSLQIVSYRSKTFQASATSTLEFSPDLDFIGKRKGFDFDPSARNIELMFERNNGNYLLNESDAKSVITSTKKCLTFPSISNCYEKENEFIESVEENSCNETTFQSKIDDIQEEGSEVDVDDFVSASEFCSSSSVAFYDLEEFYDVSDPRSSEKENCCTDVLRNCQVATPSPDFENKSVLQDESTNRSKCSKSQTSLTTKNNSTPYLFNSNEPVIIKYLNEHTQQIEEMLIYPLEYHEKLTEKIGRKRLSREEALLELIERSKYYVGKPVGIMLDVKNIRKKHKQMPEENVWSAEILKERNSERVDILETKKSLSDSHDSNTLSGFLSTGNIRYDKQVVRCRKEGHRSKDLHAFTVSCPRNLHQIETDTRKQNVRTENDNERNPCYSKICEHPMVSYTNSAVHLRANSNIDLNDQKIVVSSVSKYKSQKRYCCPLSIQKLKAVSSKSNSSWQENKYKRWLPERKQPLKSVLNSRSTTNSKKPSTFIIQSAKQREVRILRKSHNADNCTKCSMKPRLSELKGNLTRHSSIHSSLTIQKYDSSSNEHFNNYQEKWHQRKGSKRNLTHHSAECSSRAIQKYDSSSSEHLNSSQEKWHQEMELEGNSTHHSANFSSSQALQKYGSFSNNSQEKWLPKLDLSSKKRVNIEEIISSDFKTYFSSYAKRGGRLKSGSVISKLNSSYWLKKAGVVYDDRSLKFAEESFAEVARRKLVLNIYDYMQVLIVLSRRQKICLIDLVQQLKTADKSGHTDSKKKVDSNTVSPSTNLSDGSNCKIHCWHAEQLEKASPTQARERFSFPPSSTLKRITA